jgi:hypothetical protein
LWYGIWSSNPTGKRPQKSFAQKKITEKFFLFFSADQNARTFCVEVPLKFFFVGARPTRFLLVWRKKKIFILGEKDHARKCGD